MQRLFEEGRHRIEAELDLVKLMRNLRNMKLLMSNSLMSKKLKFDILHSYKNFINIDSDFSSDPSEHHTESLNKFFAAESQGTVDSSLISANLRQKSKRKRQKWA